MRILQLNLATRPFRNNRVVGSVVAGVATVLIVATVANLYIFLGYRGSYRDLQIAKREARTRLEKLQRDERGLAKQIESRDFEAVFNEGRFAGELILRHSFSWTQLFNRLEELMPPDVMMATIRPNITGAGIVVRVDGVAKTHGAFLMLEDRLLANHSFARVIPGSVRLLNPRRPEYTFTLSFDYLPDATPPPEEPLVAAVAAVKGAPAGESAPPGTPDAAKVVVKNAASGSDSKNDSPTSDPVASVRTAPTSPLGTVGRDGRTRTPEVLARLMMAPGAVFVPPETAAGSDPQRKGETGKGKTGKGKTGTEKKGTAGAGNRKTGDGKKESGRKGNAQEKPAASTSRSQPSATASRSQPAVSGGGAGTAAPQPAGRGAVPTEGGSAAGVAVQNDERTAPNDRLPGRRGGGMATPKPVPAERLDMALTFVSTPVEKVYRALEKAHGVQIILTPGVVPSAPVSVSLVGRKLDDAISIVARAANHQVKRARAGVYVVVAKSDGASISEGPIREEDISATEEQP